MKLTEWFTGDRRITDTAQSRQTGAVSSKSAELVNRQMQNLTPGQTIRGQVVSREGTNVQIRMLQDVILNARMDADIPLELGQNVTFQVKSSGQLLSLSPLFTNLSADANVMKALDMASLPVNQDTIEMTELLMKGGLPVDRATLQQVWRESNGIPGAAMEDIVDLHRLGLPVTEENVTQMNSYRNLSHQLSDGLQEVAASLTDTLQGMLQSGDTEGTAKLYLSLLQLGMENLPAEDPEQAEAQPLSGQMTGEAATEETTEEISEESAGKTDMVSAAKENVSGMIPEMPSRESLQKLSQLLEQGIERGDTALLKQLLHHEKVVALPEKLLADAWSIRPEDVESPEKVEELYQKLGKQLKSLGGILEETGTAGQTALQSTQSLAQNIDFLQQINQTYAYLQLPLKLHQGAHKNGELYVYTNKKNLAAKDGPVSALLHLDMEHLGPLDVYVSLQDTKVNTRFYVQNEGILDYLEAHMDTLTERLQKRGYDCSCNLQLREQGNAGDGAQTSGIAPLLAQTGSIPLIKNAFDVRT